MPTIIRAIILGTFEDQYWGSFKHAVSWEYQTAYDIGDLRGEYVQDSGLLGCYIGSV